MKANEVPEKIILSADRETGILYNEWVIKDLTDSIKIEYIRKDAFIDKAVKWINEHTSLSEKLVIENFINYMEGE